MITSLLDASGKQYYLHNGHGNITELRINIGDRKSERLYIRHVGQSAEDIRTILTRVYLNMLCTFGAFGCIIQTARCFLILRRNIKSMSVRIWNMLKCFLI